MDDATETPLPAAPAAPKVRAWLPYWAVFQTDLRQTASSWLYRTWVFLSVAAAAGYILYRYGVYREAGIAQSGSHLVSDLLRWTVLGSVSLLGVLAVGTIASERGTLADSVLSRGISRHQYYLAKWHARLFAVLGTFWLMAAAALLACRFLLHEEFSAAGCCMALATVSALLTLVVSVGVAVSALSSNTLVGVTFLWVGLYGVGFLLSLTPSDWPVPDRALARMPHVVRGQFDVEQLGGLAGGAVLASLLAAVVGAVLFSRRDV